MMRGKKKAVQANDERAVFSLRASGRKLEAKNDDVFQQDSPAVCTSEKRTDPASTSLADSPISKMLSSLGLSPRSFNRLHSFIGELRDDAKGVEMDCITTEMHDLEKGLVRLNDVLDQPFAEVEFDQSNYVSSRAVYRRMEQGLVPWASCHQDCIAYRQSHSDEVLATKVPKFQRSDPEIQTIIASEQNLTGLVNAVVFPVLNKACSNIMRKQVTAFCPHSSTCGSGLAMRVEGGVAASKCKIIASKDVKDLEKKGGGEMKCAVNFMKKGTSEPIDIIKEYNKGNVYIVDCVHQLAGQHCEFEAEFGVLFVWNFLWLTHLQDTGILEISEPFKSDTDGYNSLMNGFVFFAHCVDTGNTSYKAPSLSPIFEVINLKLDLPGSHDAKENDPPSNNFLLCDDGKRSRGNHKASGKHTQSGKKAGQDNTFPGGSPSCTSSQLLIFGVLQECGTRVTYKAQIQMSGEGVILKCFARQGERDSEARAYKMLEPLDFVPNLVAPPFACTYDSRRKFAIMISFAPGLFCYDLPKDMFAQVKESVRQMHEMGVAHGDLGPGNLSYDDYRGKVHIFDFGQATIRKTASDEAFAMACVQDFQNIDAWYDRLYS